MVVMFVDCCVCGLRYFRYYSYSRNPTGREFFDRARTLIAVNLLNEAVGSLSVATSSDDPNNLEESSDPLEAPLANMLDILLKGIGGGGGMTTPND